MSDPAANGKGPWGGWKHPNIEAKVMLAPPKKFADALPPIGYTCVLWPWGDTIHRCEQTGRHLDFKDIVELTQMGVLMVTNPAGQRRVGQVERGVG